jgi:cobalamin biosynthesis protein CobT
LARIEQADGRLLASEICGGAHMNVDLAQELLNELGSSLENLETQQAALLQFLKDNGIVTDDQLAPYLTQAGKTSNVRWRVARIRLERLFLNERQKEEKLRESEQHQAGAGQAPIQNQEKEAKRKNDAGSDNAAPQSEEARINGADAGKQPVSDKDNKQDERATSEDKKPSPPSKNT